MSRFIKVNGKWQTRCADPLTKKRTVKSYPNVDKDDAIFLHGKWLKARTLQRHGVADHSGMDTLYPELVKWFLEKANVSEGRRKDLKRILERNDLGVRCAADLFQENMLTERLLAGERLHPTWTRNYSIFSVQTSYKQMTKLLADKKVLPFNPLATWPLLDKAGVEEEAKAFTPYELNGVFEAVAHIDRTIGRRASIQIYLAIFFSGNRPSAVIAAKKSQLKGNRLDLPEGTRQKRNGLAYLPGIFAAALQRTRKDALPTANLFLSSEGKEVQVKPLYKEFRRAMALFYAREHGAKEFKAEELAYILLNGKPFSAGGPDPRDSKKIESRRDKNAGVLAEAQRLEPGWLNWVEGRYLYSLKHTFATWCEQLDLNDIALRLQMGHAPRDISDKHYKDKRFAAAAVAKTTQAVFDVLIGRRKLPENELTQAEPAVRIVNGGWVEMAGLELGDNTTSGGGLQVGIAPNTENQKSGTKMPPLYVPPQELIMASNLQRLEEAGVIKRVANRTRTGNLKNHNHAPGYEDSANLSDKARITEQLNHVSSDLQNPPIDADSAQKWQENGDYKNLEAISPHAQEVNTPGPDNPLFHATSNTDKTELRTPDGAAGLTPDPEPYARGGLKTQPALRIVNSGTRPEEAAVGLKNQASQNQPTKHLLPDYRVLCGVSELVNVLVRGFGCRIFQATNSRIDAEHIYGQFEFSRAPLEAHWNLYAESDNIFPFTALEFHKQVQIQQIPPDDPDPDLARVENAWPTLTDLQRQQILKIIKGVW